MKDYHNLILRLITALIIRPEFFYILLVFLTMSIPYLIFLSFGYEVYFGYSTKILLVNGIQLEFIDACVASSAYYLLILLILTTKDIGIKKSVKMFILGSLLIFIMNVLRITLLGFIVINFGKNWFELIHITFWYFVSSLYVFLVWIYLIKRYRINTIPVYSDAKYLISRIRNK